jgi:hypothetical protein
MMYSTSTDTQLSAQGKGTFEALRMIETINRTLYTPVNGAPVRWRLRKCAPSNRATD